MYCLGLHCFYIRPTEYRRNFLFSVFTRSELEGHKVLFTLLEFH